MSVGVFRALHHGREPGAPTALLPEPAAGMGAPVNALAMPDGPSPRELGALGAARVTFGGGLQERIASGIRDLARQLREG
jgi:hypothetical protein